MAEQMAVSQAESPEVIEAIREEMRRAALDEAEAAAVLTFALTDYEEARVRYYRATSRRIHLLVALARAEGRL